jgi:hypothetical protein
MDNCLGSSDANLLEEATMHGDMTALLKPPPSVYWLLLALFFCLPPLILWSVRGAQHKSLAARVCGLWPGCRRIGERGWRESASPCGDALPHTSRLSPEGDCYGGHWVPGRAAQSRCRHIGVR